MFSDKTQATNWTSYFSTFTHNALSWFLGITSPEEMVQKFIDTGSMELRVEDKHSPLDEAFIQCELSENDQGQWVFSVFDPRTKSVVEVDVENQSLSREQLEEKIRKYITKLHPKLQGVDYGLCKKKWSGDHLKKLKAQLREQGLIVDSRQSIQVKDVYFEDQKSDAQIIFTGRYKEAMLDAYLKGIYANVQTPIEEVSTANRASKAALAYLAISGPALVPWMEKHVDLTAIETEITALSSVGTDESPSACSFSFVNSIYRATQQLQMHMPKITQSAVQHILCGSAISSVLINTQHQEVGLLIAGLCYFPPVLQIQASVIGGLPIGAIVPLSTSEVPSEFLECNGTEIDASEYPDLYHVIGGQYGSRINGSTIYFNVPDLRGQFLRGWDHGAGIDPDASSRTDRGDGMVGDAVGTKQEDSVIEHLHSYGPAADDFWGIDASADHSGPDIWGFHYTGSDSVYTSAVAYSSSDVTEALTSDETRPININVLYVILAKELSTFQVSATFRTSEICNTNGTDCFMPNNITRLIRQAKNNTQEINRHSEQLTDLAQAVDVVTAVNLTSHTKLIAKNSLTNSQQSNQLALLKMNITNNADQIADNVQSIATHDDQFTTLEQSVDSHSNQLAYIMLNISNLQSLLEETNQRIENISDCNITSTQQIASNIQAIEQQSSQIATLMVNMTSYANQLSLVENRVDEILTSNITSNTYLIKYQARQISSLVRNVTYLMQEMINISNEKSGEKTSSNNVLLYTTFTFSLAALLVSIANVCNLKKSMFSKSVFFSSRSASFKIGSEESTSHSNNLATMNT